MLDGGFFSKEEAGHGKHLPRLTGCAACGLHKDCQTPKMQAQGKGEKGILIVSEMPCDSEDKAGKFFVGEASKFLKNNLAEHGIDIARDCRKIAAVSCRKSGGKEPNSNEIMQCRPRVEKEIEEFKPTVIILLGNAAVESVIGALWKKDLGTITKWRGFTIPDVHYKAWICPIFHPSFVLRSEKEPVVEVIWKKDLKRAVGTLEKSFPSEPSGTGLVKILETPREIVKTLSNIKDWEKRISIDFETTGLKPDAPVQELLTCSISTSGINAFAFNFPMKGRANKALKELLEDPTVECIAHNAKYENRWAKKFGIVVANWIWCSMLSAHQLDNRRGVSGLKFQVYVNFGIADYDSSMESFIKSANGEGAYATNRMKEAPRKDVLIYNGMDSMFTFRLAEKQMAMIEKGVYK